MNRVDTIVVHVAEATTEYPDAARAAGLHTSLDDPTNLMRVYRQLTDDATVALQFLLPESMKAFDWLSSNDLDGVSIVWYSDQLPPAFSVPSDRRNVWIVNGRRTQIVDWRSVRMAALRRNSDIMVFSSTHPNHDRPYDEWVRVDESKHILGFQRLYSDSPVAATPLPQPASLAVCGGEHARAVVAHLLMHGWNAASIGGLTQRFHVAWSDIPSPYVQNAHGINPSETPRSSGRSPRQVIWQAPPETGPDGPADTALPSRPGTVEESLEESGHLMETATWGGVAEEASSDSPVDSYMSLDDVDPTGVENPETGLPHVLVNPNRGRSLQRAAKRTLDILFSAFVLLLASPMLLVVAVLVKLTSPGPVFFGHKRQGLHGIEFFCLKFRTMVMDADHRQAALRDKNEVDGPQFKMSNDPRLTRLGFWLARYNIDEIPQFFNVLRGQMSVVGPRPSPDKENQFCPGWRRARLSVRPGITGLWQVMRLRNQAASDFQEWIYYDLEYVRHQSMWLDLRLMVYTPFAMFASKRIGRFAQRLKNQGVCVDSAWILTKRSAGIGSGRGTVQPVSHRPLEESVS